MTTTSFTAQAPSIQETKMTPSQPCDPNSDPSTAPDSQISTTASIQYWNAISPDVNGMLGGFPQISRIDLRGSLTFITKLRRLTSNCQVRNAPKLSRAVDCGAGIGRVTEGF